MKFKTEVAKDRFELMHPKAQEIAIFMDGWVQKNHNIELTITATVSTLAEDRELKRQSDTHRTGRAFDIRTSDLSETLIAQLCAVTRTAYGKFGAISNTTGPSLIIYKPHGSGPHIHVQLNRKHMVSIDKEKLNAKS
jgi:hypothetical protein